MRYWLTNEDEDYDRELERARRSGAALPAPVSILAVAAISSLVAGEAALFVSLLFDFWLH